MCAAGSILRGDVRAFHVEAFDRRAFGHSVARAGQIPESGQKVFGRGGDQSRKAPRDTGREHGAKSACDFSASDFFVRRMERVEVDAGKTVDLQIDEPRSEPDSAVIRVRRHHSVHILKGAGAFHQDYFAGRHVTAVAFHKRIGFFTAYSHAPVANSAK